MKLKEFDPAIKYGATLDDIKVADLEQILDSNENEMLEFDENANAVNYLRIANAATGNAPAVSAQGEDTNIDVVLIPKGTGTVNPTGVLELSKGLIGARVKKTAAYTTTTSEFLVGVDTTSAAVTITLGSATVTSGRVVIINDEGGSAGTNNITVATEGSETIDGAATQTIAANYGTLRLYSDGTNWFTF